MRHHVTPHRSARSKAGAIGLCGSVLTLMACAAGCIPDLNTLVSGRGRGGGGAGAVASSSSEITAGSGGSGGAGTGGKGATASSTGMGGAGGKDAVASSTGMGGMGAGGKSGTGGAGGSGGAAAPTLHWDFETDLEGWQPVTDQIPPDVQDNVVQSKTAAHHGTGALDIVFDGTYTPTTGASFYGVYTELDPPPAGAHVTAWMMTTAAGVSGQFYIQASPDYSWVVVSSSSNGTLTAGVWKQISFTIPVEYTPLRLGIQLATPLSIKGDIYLDEISW